MYCFYSLTHKTQIRTQIRTQIISPKLEVRIKRNMVRWVDTIVGCFDCMTEPFSHNYYITPCISSSRIPKTCCFLWMSSFLSITNTTSLTVHTPNDPNNFCRLHFFLPPKFDHQCILQSPRLEPGSKERYPWRYLLRSARNFLVVGDEQTSMGALAVNGNPWAEKKSVPYFGRI